MSAPNGVRTPTADRQGERVLTGSNLRALLAVCCLLAVAVVVAGETSQRLSTWSIVLTAVLVAGTVLLPGTAFPTAFLVVVVLATMDRVDPSALRLLSTAALLHAVHLLAGLCALGPRTTRFARAALAPTLRRWALAQLVALPVLVAVRMVDRAGLAAVGVQDWVEVGAGALAVLVLLGAVALARRWSR